MSEIVDGVEYPDEHQYNVDALNEIADRLKVSGSGSASAGSKSTQNSTSVPLGANGTFTGDWVTNSDDHVAFSVSADQGGWLYLDFSLDDGTTFFTARSYEIQANEGRFDALVKGAGRPFRLRYENNATAQGVFRLYAATGANLFPFSKLDRDLPAKMVHGKVSVNSEDNYMMMVDLSDIETFPHNERGRVDVYGTGFFVSKSGNAQGTLQIGVITRISATDADISFTHGVSFTGSSDRSFSRDRPEDPPDRLGQTGGVLTSFATNFLGVAVTQVNTATPLETNYGTAIPAVGDIVGRFHVTNGILNTGAITLKYAGNVSTT